VLAAELERTNFPEIVGTSEAAELLGISRQRIHELRTAGRFPTPTVEFAAGPIWLRPAIDAFGATVRKPGRPRSMISRSAVDLNRGLQPSGRLERWEDVRTQPDVGRPHLDERPRY
jgi:hypothetical protein